MSLSPSCRDRGWFAVLVTRPKLGSRTLPLGVPMITTLGVLNDSARNSIWRVSMNRKLRKTEASTFQYAEVRIRYRPRFPKVYGAGAANADVLNHLPAVGLSRFGS